MKKYTEKLNYIKQELSFGEEFVIAKYNRLKIDEYHPSYQDANQIFCQSKFKFPYIPLFLEKYDFSKEIENLDVNVLRLLIRENSEDALLKLPKEIIPFKNFILEQINYHRQHYYINKDAFIYITIRTCNYDNLYYENSKTWHIDGFQGSKIKRHIPEQNFIWCNKLPTEFLLQPMFCEGLNGSRHNINDFFEKNAKDNFSYEIMKNGIYIMTPYNIHRVNLKKFKGIRVFIRLNFSPVLIEDSTNTINPMIPQNQLQMVDVRNFLSNYDINEMKLYGLKK